MWTSQDAALVHGGGAMWTEAKRGWWRHGDAARDWAARRPPRSSPGLASALWLAGGRRLGRSCFRREPCPPPRCLYLARACCVWAGGPLALQPVRAGCLCSVVWFSCSRDASSHVCPWDDLGRFPGSPGATALPSAGALLLSQPASSPAVSLRGRGHASRPFTVCGSVACGAPPRPQGRSGFAASGASRWRRPCPVLLLCAPASSAARPLVPGSSLLGPASRPTARAAWRCCDGCASGRSPVARPRGTCRRCPAAAGEVMVSARGVSWGCVLRFSRLLAWGGAAGPCAGGVCCFDGCRLLSQGPFRRHPHSCM